MEKYWKGGVSAIISQGKLLSSTDNINRNDISEGLSRKNNIQSGNELVKNALIKRGKSPISSNYGNEIINKQNFKREEKKIKNISAGKDDGSSDGVQSARIKRRKNVDDELRSPESDTANILSNDVNQGYASSSELRAKGSLECPKGHSSNDLKLRGNSFECNGKRAFRTENETTDGNIDKSSYTVFVGNLPLSYDHKKVVKLFSKFGKVETARIRCVPVANANIKKKISAIAKKYHPNRKSAIAYVVFKAKDSVDKAIAENGMILNGHHLRIDACVSQKRDSKKSVFVGGLPFDIEDDELWDFFKDCGEIEGVRIIRDDKVSMGKGFGYVNFKSSASVELALKLNGQELKSRKINVERCTQKKNKTNPTKSFIYDKKKKRGGKPQGAIPGRKLKPNSSTEFDFQGRKAEKRPKKKKKALTKNAIRKNQIKSVFQSPSDKT